MAVGAVSGLKEFPTGTQHFVTPDGMSSIVKHFIAESSPDVTLFQHHVSSIKQVGEKLLVCTQGFSQQCAAMSYTLVLF